MENNNDGNEKDKKEIKQVKEDEFGEIKEKTKIIDFKKPEKTEKKEKVKKESGADELSFMDIADQLVLVLDGKSSVWKTEQMLKVGLVAGRRQPLLLNPEARTCKILTTEEAAYAINAWFRTQPAESMWRQIKKKKLLELIDQWLISGECIKEPKPWGFNGDPEYVFHRLDWDYIPQVRSSDCPMFMEIMGRTSNARAFMGFLGSLFFDDSDLQQYVWMYGGGMNGKGSILTSLRLTFGSSFSTEVIPSASDRFFTAGLINKRIVAFPDTNNDSWVTSGLFKSLTGGDPIRYEAKYSPSYSFISKAKFIFQSNDKPNLSGHDADIRRAIYCEFGDVPQKRDVKYTDNLFKESPNWLSYCIDIYTEMQKKTGHVEVETCVTNSLIEENEEHFRMLAENHFIFNQTYRTSINAMTSQLLSMFEGAQKRFIIKKFKDYLKRVHNVTRGSIRLGSTGFGEEWKGVQIKSRSLF